MDNKQDALDSAYLWLSIRLKRASYVEGELLTLITKPSMTDSEKKRYEDLVADNKSVGLKEVVSVIEGLKEEGDNVVGFEEFE